MDTRKLRRQVEALGPRGPGRRFPPELRSRLVAAARELGGEGRSLTRIAEELGVSQETLRRWLSPSTSSELSLVPVEVVDDPQEVEPLVLVSPRGYRLLGLELDEALELLQALG